MKHWWSWRTYVRWGRSGWNVTTDGVICWIFFSHDINSSSRHFSGLIFCHHRRGWQIVDGDGLTTDLHTKPTDTHQYLHRWSCYPSHCKTSIALTLALRLWRICSRPMDYECHMDELRGHLVKRGYDGEEIQQQIIKATKMTREELLLSQEKNSTNYPISGHIWSRSSSTDAHSPWPPVHH